MPKKIIREEKHLMLIQQISEIEKELISLKNSNVKKEANIQMIINEILKTNDRIIKDLKLLEDVATIQNNLHIKNIKKIKILETLIHFSLGMNIGVVMLLVFLKMKGIF